jgi:hypothetical protein
MLRVRLYCAPTSCLLLLIFCACGTTVRTSTLAVPNNRVQGIFYYLPQGVVHVSASLKTSGTPSKDSTQPPAPPSNSEQSGSQQYVVTVTPSYERSSTALLLEPTHNPFFHDGTTLAVDPSTMLLTTEKSSSEDQTKEILSTAAEIAESAFALGAAAVEVSVGDVQDYLKTYTNPIPLDALERVHNILHTADQYYPKNLVGGSSTDSQVVTTFEQNEAKTYSDLVTKSGVSNVIDPHDLYNYLTLFLRTAIIDNGNGITDAAIFEREIGYKKSEGTSKNTASLIPFDIVFRPDVETERTAAINAVSAITKDRVGLDVRRLPEKTDFHGSGTLWKDKSGRQLKTVGGIVFPPVYAYRITVFIDTSKTAPTTPPVLTPNLKNTQVLGSQVVLIPDTDLDHVYAADFTRTPFVTRITNVGFSNGMLVSYEQDLPSPVLGFLQIPQSILAAIVPIPGLSKSPGSASKSTASNASASKPAGEQKSVPPTPK